MTDVISFQNALADSEQYGKRLLFLGNGFSIACMPDIFQYRALYEQADFSDTPEVEEVFTALNTHDFEVVIHGLESAASILPVYTGEDAMAGTLREHAAIVKDLLVRTVAGNHPPNPNAIDDVKFWHCRNFLGYFLNPLNDGRVYTLNYDLLLYWVLMHDDNPFVENLAELNTNDGFGEDEDVEDADYVVWKAESGSNQQRVHYLHGALHLFDSGAELKKYTWNRVGIPLVEQARDAIQNDMYPLFVSEGTSPQKLAKIRHNAYLEHSYKSFHSFMTQTKPSLFIYGHSLAKNDDHVLKKIGRGRIPCIYVSLFGDPTEQRNRDIIANADALAAMRNPKYPLKVKYFDAQSANVWGPGE